MYRKKLTLYFFIIISINVQAQNKKWHHNYWIGANTGVLLGSSNQAINFGTNAGRKIGSYKLGLDYQIIEFSSPIKVKIISLYFDKSIKEKNRELFFFAQPGMAFIADGETALRGISNLEYAGSKAGINLQFGSGIRWLVKQHSFYLSAGYSITKYTLHAIEYPIPVNPYNPFKEDYIDHKYENQYNKIQVRLGFNL